MMKKIGILSSHNGSGYITLDTACKSCVLDAKIAVVISNNSKAGVIESAKIRNTPAFVINNNLFPNEDLDEKITLLFEEYGCDFIFLSGYMKKLESKLINKYENKIINSHPALLPKFGGKGMYGRFVHEKVIDEKECISGVTIHFVNEEYDKGEFIIQNSISIEKYCTVDELEENIKKLESLSIIEAFQKLL
jgi:phosphoribosylglycinamide formyltransferase-1